MEFNESIKQFSERVSMMKDTVSTEEATKMSLIVPLFQILGYDVFNPLEFCPEVQELVKRMELPDYPGKEQRFKETDRPDCTDQNKTE